MSESETKTTNVVSRYAQPYRVKLSRDGKGVYRWEIEVNEANPDAVLYALDYLDGELRTRYQTKNEEVQQ